MRMVRRLVVAAFVTLAFTSPAQAQVGTAALKPCTPKTPFGTSCQPYFGGALRIGDPPYSDTIMSPPCNVAGCGTSNIGLVHNFSAAGDGSTWLVNFSYAPGDPISDTAIGVLIYDDQWNVVQLQNPVGNPPHTIAFPFPTKNNVVYQIQVFDYSSIPPSITYTIGVSKAP